MYIKRYTIAAFLLIVLVGGYVYSYITQDSLSINLFGIQLPALSIAFWVTVPLLLLFLASVGHMAFYSLLGNLNNRKYEKDHEKLLDLIVDAYLGKKDREHEFKTAPYSLVGRLLDNSTVFPNGKIDFKFDNAKTQKMTQILDVIENIKNGEVVELKQYKLSQENALVVQNERNRYKTGVLTADELLANSTKYADVLRTEVFVDFVQKASLVNILKYKVLFSKDSLFALLSRVHAEDFTLEISNEELVPLVKSLEFNTREYIELSQHISHTNMIPDQRMKLFELLSEDNDVAMPGYLYTLFDLEMLSPVKDILDNSQPDEYQNFKAYNALKSCNKNFNIELFV